jgi:hypothetical protein
MAFNKEEMKVYNKKYRKTNKTKLDDRKKKWTLANKEKIAAYHLKRTYGLSVEDYNSMLKIQKYKCATCGILDKDTQMGKLFVDHCHKTGSIRGLLCSKCNSALGLVNENIEILTNLISYIKEQAYEELQNEEVV